MMVGMIIGIVAETMVGLNEVLPESSSSQRNSKGNKCVASAGGTSAGNTTNRGSNTSCVIRTWATPIVLFG
jgi:hypothetical protein